jgi:peptidoglycan hydrolase CwlO-like protein
MNIFENSVVKNIAISLVMGAIGFGTHQAVESVSQTHQLETQNTQIQKLFEGQSETHTQVQDLSVALARMEGKLDVLNQKIDDDRSKTRR